MSSENYVLVTFQLKQRALGQHYATNQLLFYGIVLSLCIDQTKMSFSLIKELIKHLLHLLLLDMRTVIK